MIKDYKAFILTLVQYTTLPLMMWKMTWFSSNPYLLAIQVIGLLIATLGVWEMKKSKLNIAPTPKQGAFLVNTGIYSLIRHPMYSSLLIIFTPMLFENQNTLNLSLFFLFSINLILKLEYEENLLILFFKDYKVYKKKTWKILPYIY